MGGTLAFLLREMLPLVDTDFVAFIEDDDVYSADYLEYQLANLNHYEKGVIGINPTVYYHLKWRSYMKIDHPGRASLFTIFGRTEEIREALLPIVADDEVTLIDYKLCDYLGINGETVCTPGYNRAIGIKHNIGISGGSAHEWGSEKFDNEDYDFEFLEGACGSEFIDFYKEIAESL
jgi:hypothetical protein